MGFPQLLAANRSLRNIRNGPSRYKMTQANLLPRFSADAEAGPAGRATVPVAGVPGVRAAKGRDARVQPAGMASAPAPAPRFQPRLGQTTARPWWQRLANPFGSSGGAAGQGPVQAELILGSVEPVRNMLGESDLQLVGNPGSAPSPAGGGSLWEAATPVPAAEVRPGLWRRWSGRVLGWLGHDRA